ncbi:hypothetical protein BU24DRAFT_179344 [Aaosphaeria arxii CBS 175.79]|uniref:Uncharacterized protein n=1 Tax=Aaosphaeria arxii CBS 175.79 TaxID=1450172 RepID=A0A6A5XRC2_9PLEO|nr:uncharacterized protein BU24DRAFT_179344 [Aaosphaeria arxii CBS 175.79]KAF2015483.1 hypothetical protein BU24DRAFT_179344 [Aaosphaeria arxii CBS 175.79]
MFGILEEASDIEGIQLFPLEPETSKAMDPVHPFTLIQDDSEYDEDGETAGSTPLVREGPQSVKDDQRNVYDFLSKTFKWEPLYDWDWLMQPERMAQSVDPAYQKIYDKGDYMERIKTQFQYMREAGIPIHILIGRRKYDTSSCYWGWPYNAAEWQNWLDQDFDANFDEIAPFVDKLSIVYDMRNPLDDKRLRELDMLEPYKGPSARCPQTVCPWSNDEISNCPFKRPNQSAQRRSRPRFSQKMAHKRVLRPQAVASSARLIPKIPGYPPTGENADDHPSDNDKPECTVLTPIHHLARQAVYAREAVGWLRFWSTYALCFTQLKSLHFHMPRFFDEVISGRLSRLLNQKKGWEVINYTNERQHMQTSEDLLHLLPKLHQLEFENKQESKIWPAGPFCSRTWFWAGAEVSWRQEYTIRGLASAMHVPNFWRGKYRILHDTDWVETKALEYEAVCKAVDRAEQARENEQEAESDDIRQDDKVKATYDRKQRDEQYVDILRNIGHYEWRQRLEGEIRALERHIQARTHDGAGGLMVSEEARFRKELNLLGQLQRDPTPIFGKSGSFRWSSFLIDKNDFKRALR